MRIDRILIHSALLLLLSPLGAAGQSASSSQASGGFTVSVSDGISTVAPGETMRITARVRNTSNNARTTDVSLRLSEHLIVEAINPHVSSDSTMYTWNNVPFAAGEERMFTVRGTVRPRLTEYLRIDTTLRVGQAAAADSTVVQYHETGGATSSAARSSSRSRSSRTARSRSVLFSHTADTNEILPGGTVRYTLYVQNVLLNTIDDAVITARFDPEYLIVTDTGGASTSGAGRLQWQLPRLLPGETWQRTYTMIVSTGLQHGTQISNIATLTGDDVTSATLDEKVLVVSSGVVGHLPATGAPYDIILLLLALPAAAVCALVQRTLMR